MKKLSSGHLAVIGLVFFIGAGALEMPAIGLIGAGFWIAALVKWTQTGK